jgi:predicted amidohydrolase YtcJ
LVVTADLVVFERVEVAGIADRSVVVRDGRVVEIGSRAAVSGAVVIDGAGGALLPGLNDHHLHLFSAAAYANSVLCAPSVGGRADIAAALRAAAAGVAVGEWVRGVGYDDSASGALSSLELDEMLGALRDRAVRIQHRSGHAWILNSTARHQLGLVGDGLLVDADERVRTSLGAEFPDLSAVSRGLAGYGVTGVTDAGPDNGPIELAEFERQVATGQLRQRCLIMGGAQLPSASSSGRVRSGPYKVMLADGGPLGLDELIATIERVCPRPVAVHAVTVADVVVAATAIATAGGGGHRIEHASVADPEVVALVARSGATVVTQPGFVLAHGDRYRREIDSLEWPWLYRVSGWTAAGVAVAAGSDAPFGPIDPWQSMQTAVDRRTALGEILGPDERVSPEAALALYTGDLIAPGPSRIAPAVGDPADLTLLRVPWRDARTDLTAQLVRATFVGGELIFGG